MKSTGIRRKVDDLGRVVIPAGIRHSLGIREGDVLDVALDGDTVILAKPAERCVLCGAEEPPFAPVRDKLVCRPCVGSVGVLDQQLRSTSPPDRDTPASAGPRTAAEPVGTSSWSGTRADERVAGVRDERREVYDPASTTAW